MKRYIIIFSTAIALILVLIFGIRFKSRTSEREYVLNRLEQLEQLVTAKQVYKEVLYLKKTEDFLWIPIKQREFLISVEYDVIAGVDLSKGYKVSREGDTYIVELPKAEIISIDANDRSLKEYYIKEQFSKLTRDDYFGMIQESKEKIIQGDDIEDLLSIAEYNAVRLIRSLLQLADISVEIRFSHNIWSVNL